MLHLHSQTFLQKIMEAEKDTFMKERINEIKSVSTSDDFVDGNVLYKIPINRTSTKDLIDNHVYPLKDKEKRVRFFCSSQFMPLISQQVINIAPQKGIKACLELIYQYKKAAGSSFYGAVLRKGSKVIINPFHILTAISLLNDEKLLNESYSISIYFYSNRDKADKKYKSEDACTESMTKNIENLMLSYTNSVNTEIKITNKGEMGPNGDVRIQYKESKHPDEDRDKTHYMVTHQIVTQGIIAPYYGTSIIAKSNSSSSGIHVSPMRSCNISQDTEVIPSRRQDYRSVCTGRLSNSTLTGLRSLTHSNLSSPYNSNTLMPGFMVYADMMIEKSLELYGKAGLIEVTPQEEVCPYSDNELACKTLREFLILSNFGKKKKVKPAEAEDKFNKIQLYKKKKESQDEQQEKQQEEK